MFQLRRSSNYPELAETHMVRVLELQVMVCFLSRMFRFDFPSSICEVSHSVASGLVSVAYIANM